MNRSNINNVDIGKILPILGAILLIICAATGCQVLQNSSPAQQALPAPNCTASYRAQILQGSALLYTPTDGYNRLLWRLIGDPQRWQLAVYNLFGVRLAQLTKTDQLFQLQDQNGIVTNTQLAQLASARALPAMVDENCIKLLWELFTVNHVTELTTTSLSPPTVHHPQPWQLQILARRTWQLTSNALHPVVVTCPSRLLLQQREIAITMTINHIKWQKIK